MILLGLVIGIIGTVNVMNVLSQRNSMPTALMHTLDYHMAQLTSAIKAKQSDAGTMEHHWARLASTATDVSPVFGTDVQDFTNHAQQLQDRLQRGTGCVRHLCRAGRRDQAGEREL